jgi:hypothetical protein
MSPTRLVLYCVLCYTSSNPQDVAVKSNCFWVPNFREPVLRFQGAMRFCDRYRVCFWPRRSANEAGGREGRLVSLCIGEGHGHKSRQRRMDVWVPNNRLLPVSKYLM